MAIQQLSIFLENKSGRLTEVLEVLGREKINVTAMTIADTSDYGIVRMVLSHPAEAYRVLKDRGFSVNLSDVISLKTPTEAGSFAKVLRIFSDMGISIEYMYAFSLGETAAMVMRTTDTARAKEAIEKHGLEMIRPEMLYDL